MTALAYESLLIFGFLFYLPKALWRKRLPHRGWSMRLGHYPDAVRGRLGAPGTVWIHAVSVGETIAAKPLIEALLAARPPPPLVLSTVTPTGYHVASRWLGDRGTVIYSPLDLRAAVRRSLDAVQPRLLILLESELWPTWIRLVKARGVPVAVVNGRMSERAYRRYLRVRSAARPMLAAVDLWLMQSQTDAQRAIELGAPESKVRVLGSLKWDASWLGRPDPEQVAALARQWQLQPDHRVIVAGSTHRGEELALLEAFGGIRGHLDHAKLILAPRHLERMDEVERLARSRRMAVRRVSRGVSAEPWDVLIVDVMGQLPAYYALASVVFVGGSLIPHGGQNPIEPASLGKAVLFGPSMHNFADIAKTLLTEHAARQLADQAALTASLLELLTDSVRTEAMGRRAQEVTERARGVARRTLDALAPLLP